MLCAAVQHAFVQGQAGEHPGTALFVPGIIILPLDDSILKITTPGKQ